MRQLKDIPCDDVSRLSPLVPKLLGWFESHARDLPWRTPPGAKRDPYRVWLAEIMLQQTTVPHAAPYFLAFTARWPTVHDLAAAPDEQVMSAWAGLGYYARARNLLACAREVARRGAFPSTPYELMSLPGIGVYTAGAIAALAFGERTAAIDGNVERVFARLCALKGDWQAEKLRIRGIVEALVPSSRPGAFAEALMDLGAIVCTPKSPSCGNCPLARWCLAAAEGDAARYPVKPAKPVLPRRFGVVHILQTKDAVWTERRPPSGLLGGMLAFPTTDWCENRQPLVHPMACAWQRAGEVRHAFTHFQLTLEVWHAHVPRRLILPYGEWTEPDALSGLPTVFAKAARMAGINVPRKR